MALTSGIARTARRLTLRLTLLQRFAIASLVVFAVIGVATATALSRAAENSALSSAESTAVDTLRGPLESHLRQSDLRAPMTGHRLAHFNRIVHTDVLSSRVVVVKVWNPHGLVIYSTDGGIIGKTFPLEDDIREALEGHASADVSDLLAQENQEDRRFGRLLEVYIPVRVHGSVFGAFEIYETYGPLASQIANLEHVTYLTVGGGLLLLYVLLFGIVGAGSRTIDRQSKALRAQATELERSYGDTIMSLAAAVDARDSQTESHSRRVTELAVRLGEELELDPGSLRALRHGAELHDIGKIGVPDAILRKPGPLTEAEWELMQRHPMIGHDMIKHVSFLEDARPVVRHHHERWDGQGYPDGLAGEDIPIAARIFALADAYDAITSDRPYRRGSDPEEALLRIIQDAGTHFDPMLVAAFVVMLSDRDRGVVAPTEDMALGRVA
jgi:HD-GYP domain-containing protein (c-di-GMP phosphodiesterase class II)